MVATEPDRDAIVRALRAACARFAFLHGSHAAGAAHPDSDVDVAAWFGGANPPAWEIDVPPRVDLAVLDRASLELAGRVALHGELLLDDDPSARVDWQVRTRPMFLDEELRQRALDREFLEAHRDDERRVRLLLQRISDDLAYLCDRAAGDRRAIRADVDRPTALKYHWITVLESCLNVAQHFCATEGWGPPSDNAHAMHILASHGILAQDLAEAMAAAVRFRNLLVHEYAEIDDDRVVGYLDRVPDLERFVAAVAARL